MNNQKLSELCKKMSQIGYPSVMIERLKERVNELQQNNVQGVEAFLDKLSKRINGKQDYHDILIEGRFAVVLARNGFTEIYLEYSESAPDISAIFNRNTIYFEITRRREGKDEWRLAEPDVVDWIDPDKVDNIRSKILGKVRQLESGEINIVVIWSDTIGLRVSQMKEAFKYIQQEIDNEPQKYQELSGVLFTTGGTKMPELKQFYLFKNNCALKRLPDNLAKKLDSLCERDPVP